ncbi:RidA family protein [Georgenia sp. AZ-5]|uniref:RidA family protein n=1 Tax=Georgenia sp. AZ-5 TaxID=3367526 RepID=UPI003755160F
MITHINPDGMYHSPVFSQAVLLDGPGRLLVVGGQNGVDESGAVVADDVAGQTAKALENLLTVLAEVGADQRDVAKLTIYMVAGQEIGPAYGAAQAVWGEHPTAISMLQVAGLGSPDFLVEIEALAYLQEEP